MKGLLAMTVLGVFFSNILKRRDSKPPALDTSESFGCLYTIKLPSKLDFSVSRAASILVNAKALTRMASKSHTTNFEGLRLRLVLDNKMERIGDGEEVW